MRDQESWTQMGKKRITCGVGQKLRHPSTHKPEGQTAYWAQKGLGTDWYLMKRKAHSGQESSEVPANRTLGLGRQRTHHRRHATPGLQPCSSYTRQQLPKHKPLAARKHRTASSVLFTSPFHRSALWQHYRHYFSFNVARSAQLSKQALLCPLPAASVTPTLEMAKGREEGTLVPCSTLESHVTWVHTAVTGINSGSGLWLNQMQQNPPRTNENLTPYHSPSLWNEGGNATRLYAEIQPTWRFLWI